MIHDTKRHCFNLFNYEIVCPYCGYEYGDSWECDDEETLTCPHCDKDFFSERNVEVTYSTHRIKEDKSIDYEDSLIEEEYED